MLGSRPQEHAQFLVARQKTTLYIYSEKLRVKKKDNPWKVKNELPEKDSHHQRKHPAAVSQDVLDQRWAHGHQAPQAAGGGLCPWAWVTPHGFTHLKLLQGVLKTWPKSLISEVVLDFFSRVLFQWFFFFQVDCLCHLPWSLSFCQLCLKIWHCWNCWKREKGRIWASFNHPATVAIGNTQ